MQVIAANRYPFLDDYIVILKSEEIVYIKIILII